MASSTLSLGSSAYELLEVLSDGSASTTASNDAVVRDRSNGKVDLLSTTRGGLIGDATATDNGVGITASAAIDLKVMAASDELQFSAADVGATNGTESGTSYADKVRLFGNAEKADLQTGGGADNIAALREFTNSQLSSGSGNDTIRIGGKADGSTIMAGAGDDKITIGRASNAVDLTAGDGADTVTFNNKLTTSEALQSVSYSDGSGGEAATQFSNLIDLGSGNDQANFKDGIEASGTSRYRVAAGSGDDTITFGYNSTTDGVDLLSQAGNDSITLGSSTLNSTINLGNDAGSDTLVLGTNASMINTTITSGNSGGDNISMVGDLSYDDSSYLSQLGSGADNVSFTGTTDFAGSTWKLGGGNDTLTMTGTGSFIDTNIDLQGGTNTVKMDTDSFYEGVVISGFDKADDILIIGSTTYTWGSGTYSVSGGEYSVDELSGVIFKA